MFSHYVEFKNKLLSGGNDSPFLQELHDDSVAREMEEWHFDKKIEGQKSETEDGSLDRSLDQSFDRSLDRSRDMDHGTPYVNHSRHPTKEWQHDADCPTIATTMPTTCPHSMMDRPTWQLNFVFFLKLAIFILCTIGIICTLLCTETPVTADGTSCDRPTTATFVIIVLFISILFNLGVMTLCEKYRLCCTVGRLETLYHLWGLVFMTASVFMFGYWLLYGTSMPWMTSNESNSTAKTTVTDREDEKLKEAQDFSDSLINLTNAIGTNGVMDGNQSEHVIVKRDAWLKMQNQNVKPEENGVCPHFPLGWRGFDYGLATMTILVVLTSFHLAALTLFIIPCFGLVRRGNFVYEPGAPRSQPGSYVNRNNNAEKKKSPEPGTKDPPQGLVTRPLILKGHDAKFVTSSPLSTPTKNQSLLRKVTNANLWGTKSGKRYRAEEEEEDNPERSQLNGSVVSRDQLLETSMDDSMTGCSNAAVVGVNTSAVDDVLFDAHDDALLEAVKPSSKERDEEEGDKGEED